MRVLARPGCLVASEMLRIRGSKGVRSQLSCISLPFVYSALCGLSNHIHKTKL